MIAKIDSLVDDAAVCYTCHQRKGKGVGHDQKEDTGYRACSRY